jgi:hypothetical protein
MDCLTIPPVGTCGAITASSFRRVPFKTGLRPREKKAETLVTNGYLDSVFSDFSGYIAVDELYDGNTCLLALVDNRRHRRLMFEILDHTPKHEDIVLFFQRFKREMESRRSRLLGITTDGSPLYPDPIRQVLGSIPHQICVFHVIKEINKAVLKAVASIRREISEKIPEAARGRPAGKAGKSAARKRKRLEKKIGDLFEHRHLFVRRKLTTTQQGTLQRITRGLPMLRTLREIVEDVYRLFDRRCRMEAGLEKIRKLRIRVKRFKRLAKILKKLLSPTLEKALIFLDEKLLPSTSNSVERTNRRFRKMQKAIYRVRAVRRIRQRVALDILREWRLPARHAAVTACG